MSDTPSTTPPKQAFSILRLALALAVVVGVGAVIYVVQLSRIEGTGEADAAQRTRKSMGLGEPAINRLGKAYRDSDGDLIADAPEGTADQLDPAELTFSFVANDDPSADAALWQALVDHLSQATGKPVQYVPYTSRDAQLRAIRDGSLHVAGLNTGAVPVAVNACGFVPVCAPGKGESAEAYKMVVIVPGSSKARSLEDVRGQQFAFTQPTSNSGCKAAIVLLEEAGGLKLGEDYEPAFTHSHAQLIQEIAAKKYAAGSTASDLLERAIQQGEVEKDAVRVIYESEPFPTAAIGMAYNLKPELAETLRQALTAFSFSGTPLAEEYAATGGDRLVPINYKDDFSLIRRIDDAVGYKHQRVLTEETDAAADENEKDTGA